MPLKSIISIFLFAIFATGAHANTGSAATLDSLLNVLDYEIANRKHAIREKQRKIGCLIQKQQTAKSSAEKVRLNDSLYYKYIYYQYDSAAYYLNCNQKIARDVADSSLAVSVEIERIHLYINYGLYWDAAYSISQVEKIHLDTVQENRLYAHKIRLYYYMHKYLETDNRRDRYQHLFNKNRKMLQQRVPDTCDLPWDIQYYIYEADEERDKITELIRNLSDYAVALHHKERLRSVLYNWQAAQAKRADHTYEMRYYLILAAIDDMRKLLSNSQSIFLLAHEMWKMGDLSRAQKYASVGLDNSITARSVINKSAMCEIVAEINADYLQKQQHTEQQLISFILLIGVLLLILAITIVLLINEVSKKKQAQNELTHNHACQLSLNAKLNELNHTLAHNNRIKEEYIGLFLGMHPYYLEKTERYRKEVVRFLKAGKIAELQEFCKKSRENKTETELLHKEFDRMFLNIIPSFIDEFNSLLRDDARIYPKSGELTIELRIFALIRLGIKDSANIARYLRYSVNTIYSYRSRVKNGSLGNRDEFENQVMQIGRVE